MKRFLRWTVTVVAILSLLVCAFSIAAPHLQFQYQKKFGDWSFERAVPVGFSIILDRSGGANLGWARDFGSENLPKVVLYGESYRMANDRRWSFCGLEFGRIQTEQILTLDEWATNIQKKIIGEEYWLVVPWSWITALTAMAPLFAGGIWIRALRHPRRSVENHCAKCGYDLRGTPDRCPECGEIAKKMG